MAQSSNPSAGETRFMILQEENWDPLKNVPTNFDPRSVYVKKEVGFSLDATGNIVPLVD